MRILKRMHGRGLVVLAVLGLTAAVTAIAPLASADDPPATNDWRVSYDQEFDNNLNPFAAQFTSDYFVFTEVYDLLLNFKLSDNSPDLENSPAQSFESSPDGKVWTYKLRPGIKWADGVPFTADDVVWTLQTVVDTADDPGNVLSGYLPTPDKIEKVDDLTVKITLRCPNVRMSSMYIPILPKHIWEKADPKKIKDFDPFTEITDATTGEKKKAIIGTGPFMVTKLDKKGTTILERNPYFYGPKGEIDRMLMVKYGDKDPQLRDIKLGKLDAILSGQPEVGRGRGEQQGHHDLVLPEPRLLGDRLQLLHRRGRVAVHRRRQGRHKDVVQDPAIRHALYYALNRPEVVKTVLQNQGIVGNGLISPYYASYFQDFSKDPEIGYQYDPAKAKEVLAAGGWDCPAGGTCTKNGVKAEFDLLVRQNNQDDQNAAQRYAADAKAVGIDMKLADRVRGPDQRADLRDQPDRREQVRADLRRVLLGLGRRQRLAGVQLRRARLRLELAGLDVLQPGVRQARQRRAPGARRHEAHGYVARRRADRAEGRAVPDHRPLERDRRDAERHLDGLRPAAGQDRRAVLVLVAAAAADQEGRGRRR